MTTSEGALAGMRVIDLTRVLAGPSCTQMLGDHGAEVIKVEPPQGDETRGWGPPFLDEDAAYFIGVNRNKRGFALDLSKPKGREVLLRLLERADVLIENYKTGTLERWGLGYDEVLKERFPRLVHCRITGFGADGPLGGYPGYDAAVQGQGGVMATNGEPDQPPLRVGVPVVDLATGLNAMIGILLALQERTRSGKGQFLEIALFDCALASLHPYSANWLVSGKPPAKTGNAHPNIAPYDQFPTATTPIFLAVGNDRQFARLAAELGRPELANDPRFRINSDRVAHRDALRRILVEALASLDGPDLTARLLARGVPCGAVLDVPGALSQPHAEHRGMIWGQGPYKGVASPVKLDRTPPRLKSPPPAFGEANRAVLKDAGYGEAEIAALIAEGIVPDRIKRMAED